MKQIWKQLWIFSNSLDRLPILALEFSSRFNLATHCCVIEIWVSASTVWIFLKFCTKCLYCYSYSTDKYTLLLLLLLFFIITGEIVFKAWFTPWAALLIQLYWSELTCVLRDQVKRFSSTCKVAIASGPNTECRITLELEKISSCTSL